MNATEQYRFCGTAKYVVPGGSYIWETYSCLQKRKLDMNIATLLFPFVESQNASHDAGKSPLENEVRFCENTKRR